MADNDPKTRSRRVPSAEEARLFLAAMADVRPLDGGPRPAETAEAPAAPPTATAVGLTEKAAPARPAQAHPELRPGVAAGLDARTLTKLRRGRLRPETRLDLHGMTQERAAAALHGFLAEAQARGRRCVLVITGKGSVADGGVLRRLVPLWLNAPATRARILGIAEARAQDGGAGALYVLLRRADKGARPDEATPRRYRS